MADHPRLGADYPRSLGELQSWFGTDDDCLDYLKWLRWPDGFVCPQCAGGGWLTADGRYKCARCNARTSVTAGTLFDRHRSPLTVWFNACWQFATAKDGVSALSLQRMLEIGSVQTAWAMLHRLRSVLVRPGRERLNGIVEMDETLLGGVRPGGKGGRTPGEKILVGVGIEHRKPRGFGRCRLAVLPDASTESLGAFLAAYVEPGSTVVTDGWQPYRGALAGTYEHERYVAPGRLAHELLPGVHRVASLLDRWLLSTHQGAVGGDHIQPYLDEFSFRFNRRTSRSRGLLFYRVLELAVVHEPVRYHELIVEPSPRKRPPRPPGSWCHPPSLERPPAARPWRAGRQPG